MEKKRTFNTYFGRTSPKDNHNTVMTSLQSPAHLSESRRKGREEEDCEVHDAYEALPKMPLVKTVNSNRLPVLRAVN